MQRSSRLTQQLWERWVTLLNYLETNPKVAQVRSTRMGQYLSSRPLFAFTLLLFAVMASLPVGIFLAFALVTVVMSAAGFVFFEVLLLFVGGLTLLSVLSGIAIFSVVASVVVNAFFITIPSLLQYKNPQTKKDVNHETVGGVKLQD
ncbi:unnamed protein product [Menidia menidia]|uniref:(Atlantic silverside) hypothetical protein n=1 Tax=Menidia menidia TaxID=238744 RepID=A0A8S4AV69_9TELE|nr:unnamed protein product [Menidia menidia]